VRNTKDTQPDLNNDMDGETKFPYKGVGLLVRKNNVTFLKGGKARMVGGQWKDPIAAYRENLNKELPVTLRDGIRSLTQGQEMEKEEKLGGRGQNDIKSKSTNKERKSE